MRVSNEPVLIKEGHSIIDYRVELDFVDDQSGYQKVEYVVADNRYEAIGKAILKHTGETLPLGSISVWAAVHSE